MSFFMEGMKEGFRVVKLVGKGGDSLLESGENAAGESDSDGKYLDEDHVVWCAESGIIHRDFCARLPQYANETLSCAEFLLHPILVKMVGHQHGTFFVWQESHDCQGAHFFFSWLFIANIKPNINTKP